MHPIHILIRQLPNTQQKQTAALLILLLLLHVQYKINILSQVIAL